MSIHESLEQRLMALADVDVVADAGTDRDLDRFQAALARLRTDPDEQRRIDAIVAAVEADQAGGPSPATTTTAPTTVDLGDVDGRLESSEAAMSYPPKPPTADPSAGSLLGPEWAGGRSPGGVATERRSRVKAFLLWCAGARRDVLELAPTEEVNYVGLGGAVLATAVAAVVSITVALGMALQSPVWFALPFGLAWGLVIFNLDRWLVATAGATSASGRLANFLPRLALAVIIAFMIAEPLLLAVFNSEVEAKMAELQARQITIQEQQIAEGFAPRLNAIDQSRSLLDKQVSAQSAEVDRLLGQLSQEWAGAAGTGVAGTGPAYQALRARLQSAEADLARLQGDRTQQLRELRGEQRDIQAQQATDTANARATIVRNGGLLLHIQALSALSSESGAVATTIWIVRVWIILLDAMPVLVRLLQSVVGRRSYDQVLAALQHGEELEAQRLWEQAALRLRLAKEEAQRQAEAAEEKAEMEARLIRAYHEHRAEQKLAELWSTEPNAAPGKPPAPPPQPPATPGTRGPGSLGLHQGPERAIHDPAQDAVAGPWPGGAASYAELRTEPEGRRR